MNAADIARAVFSRGTTKKGEQIVCVDGLTIEDVYTLCRAVLDAEGDGRAVGEMVVIEAAGRIERNMTGDLGINWVLEGGIHALGEGTWLLCTNRKVTDDEGYGELYTNPAPKVTP